LVPFVGRGFFAFLNFRQAAVFVVVIDGAVGGFGELIEGVEFVGEGTGCGAVASGVVLVFG